MPITPGFLSAKATGQVLDTILSASRGEPLDITIQDRDGRHVISCVAYFKSADRDFKLNGTMQTRLKFIAQ